MAKMLLPLADIQQKSAALSVQHFLCTSYYEAALCAGVFQRIIVTADGLRRLPGSETIRQCSSSGIGSIPIFRKRPTISATVSA